MSPSRSSATSSPLTWRATSEKWTRWMLPCRRRLSLPGPRKRRPRLSTTLKAPRPSQRCTTTRTPPPRDPHSVAAAVGAPLCITPPRQLRLVLSRRGQPRQVQVRSAAPALRRCPFDHGVRPHLSGTRVMRRTGGRRWASSPMTTWATWWLRSRRSRPWTGPPLFEHTSMTVSAPCRGRSLPCSSNRYRRQDRSRQRRVHSLGSPLAGTRPSSTSSHACWTMHETAVAAAAVTQGLMRCAGVWGWAPPHLTPSSAA
jgi:hypothetical protein